MPVPIVAVEIAEPRPDGARDLGAVLLEACSHALRLGTCVFVEKDSEGSQSSHESPAAVARITWNEGQARVEVWVSGRPGLEKRARELEFAASHPPIERWRSVGFVAGTLANPGPAEGSPSSAASEAREGKAPTSDDGSSDTDESSSNGAESLADPPREGAADPADEPTVARDRFVSRPRIWFDLGPTTGPGFENSPWRLGGFLSVAYAVRSSFVQASLGYSAPPDDETGLSARWIAPALGVGYSLLDLRMGLSLKVRTELVLENTYVTVSTPDGAVDSGDHWAGGLRAGGDVSWNAVPGLGMFLGADLAAFTGRVHVDVAGTRTATTPAVRPSVFGGARVTIPLSAAEQHARVER